MERDEELEKRILAAAEYLETADSASEKTVYPVDEVLWAGKTQYVSELVLMSNSEHGKVLLTDGELQSSTSDEKIYHEHLIHPTMLLYRTLFGLSPIKEPLRVLVLGGGEGATVRELLKYTKEQVGEIVWNDIDKGLVDLCLEHLGYGEGKYYNEIYGIGQQGAGRVQRVYEDANTFLPELIEANRKFDIVINDLPDPGEKITELTGLYSAKFFADMHAVLNDRGVIVTHAGPTKPKRFEVADFLKDGLTSAGFCSHFIMGLVPIPSFQSEWGYIYGAKFPQGKEKALAFDTDAWKVTEAGVLPQDLEIIDSSALTRFFSIPNYYFSHKESRR
jgi:spermidine synthase